jgi:hypothetical protein
MTGSTEGACFEQAQVCRRVRGHPVLQNLEMEMRPRGLAGRSDIGYVLARQYRFTFLGDQPRCVSVSSHDLGPVVDLNDFFVAGLPPGENDPASSRSEDRRAGSCGEIDAGMELQTTIERIDTIAEPRAKSSAVRRPPSTGNRPGSEDNAAYTSWPPAREAPMSRQDRRLGLAYRQASPPSLL